MLVFDLTTRLRVDAGKEYAVPPSNPFVGRSGYAPEIFALGMRNPFRCAFSGVNPNLLYVGDVGQNAWEMVKIIDTDDVVQTNGALANYGWPTMEGACCNSISNRC